MDDEDDYSTSECYYPEDLETFHVETETGVSAGKSGGHRRFHKQKKKCKVRRRLLL